MREREDPKNAHIKLEAQVKRFLFLQFPAWERRRPRRLAVCIMAIYESI
jgi:hypothetical protein